MSLNHLPASSFLLQMLIFNPLIKFAIFYCFWHKSDTLSMRWWVMTNRIKLNIGFLSSTPVTTCLQSNIWEMDKISNKCWEWGVVSQGAALLRPRDDPAVQLKQHKDAEACSLGFCLVLGDLMEVFFFFSIRTSHWTSGVCKHQTFQWQQAISKGGDRV